MKKAISVFAAIAICSAAFGAVLQTFKNVQPGDVAVSASGKLVSVDVFSVVTSGTVSVSRVFSMAHFTNVVDTTSEVVTNVVETRNYADVFYRGDGVAFTNIGERYNTKFWEAALPGHVGYVGYNSVGKIWWYGTDWDEGAGDYDVHTSVKIPGASDDEYLRFGTGASAVEFSRSAVYIDSTFTTNVVTVVTTNSVTPVKAYDLVITNQVMNGACENGAYHGVPSGDVWFFPGDKLNFSGTATGGAMRIVID